MGPLGLFCVQKISMIDAITAALMLRQRVERVDLNVGL